MSDKQQNNKKYKNRDLMQGVKQLYLDSKTADVHFQFSSDDGTNAFTRIPAHKNLLAVMSNVFIAMFYGDLKENGDIQVTDSSATAFQEFLQFFYSDEVELTEENIVEVMYLAQKYIVSSGINICIEFLKDILTTENIFIGLNIAILYEHEELMKFCEKIIISDTKAVFESAGFLECDKNALGHILKMKILSCPEVKVFEACMQWAKSKSKQDIMTKEIIETQLGNLYYDIRFASMTMHELCTLPSEYEAALSDDFRTITKIISVPGFCSDKFHTNPRLLKWNEDASMKCDRVVSTSEYWFKVPPKEKIITVSTTEPLLLGGFTRSKIGFLDGNTIQELETDLSIEVKITEALDERVENNTAVLLSMRTNMGSKNTSYISLPQPVLMKPGFFYSIHIESFPDTLLVKCQSSKNMVQLDPNIVIKFHNSKAINRTVDSLISELYFNAI